MKASFFYIVIIYMNSTLFPDPTDDFSVACKSYLEIGSLVLNAVLTLVIGISEGVGRSKCKENSISDFIAPSIHSLRRFKRDIDFASPPV